MTSKETSDVRNLRPLIQQHLDEWCKKHQANFALKVSERVVEQHNWTYYTVAPDREGVWSYDYVSALVEIERFLSAEKNEKKVLLLPAIPGEEPI